MVAGRTTILVVDDDPTSRILARSHLEQDGYAVVEAVDGVEALGLAQVHVPDLVLLDVDMPRMDGFAACEGLRAIEALERTPIVMMTGAQDDAAIDTAYRSGATDFVVKPVLWAIMRNRVRYLLRAGEMVAELDESRRMLAEAQQLASMGNWAWQSGDEAITCSAECRRMLGFAPDTEVTLEAFLGRFDPRSRVRIQQRLDEALDEPDEIELACDFRFSGHEVRHALLRMRALGRDGDSGRTMGTLQDVTERHRNESRIRQLAYFDTLTTLPNREAFMQHLGDELTRSKKSHQPIALFFLGIDDFKRLNDSLGSSMGDRLLRAVGDRLTATIRSCGLRPANGATQVSNIVSRLGGDEFSVVASGVGRGADAETVATRLVEALSTPFLIDGHDAHLSVSIGIASYPGDGEDVETLLKCAGTAMKHTKQAGKNGFSFFRRAMGEGERRRTELEAGLRKALAGGDFQIHYQPQVDVQARGIDGVEALLRWDSDTLGAVSPGEFIPVAEATRLIIPIGNWVLRKACEQMVRWDQEGMRIPRVAVNVSLVQFSQADFPKAVRRALDASGLRPDRLELEITESVLAVDVEHAVRMLRDLNDIGIQLSIDDFGTGYSSLGYLKRFPVDRLKIDRCFVRDIASDPDDAAIAEAVLGLARSMRLGVVAEGVETLAQLNALRTRHCSLFQGFLFARPTPAAELANALAGIDYFDGDTRPEADPPNVLIVDDDVALLEAAGRALARESFRVHTLPSAEQAIDYIARCPVDVVVSDQSMPGLSGVDFLSRVQRIAPDTVRILMSGANDHSALVDAINLGAATRLLEKPVPPDTLRKTLLEALQSRKRPARVLPMAV